MAELDLDWLRDFVGVAKLRSFTLVARDRGVSPSTLIRRIEGLEQWLGQQLLDRKKAPLELTAAGEEFLKFANPIIDNLRRAKNATGVATEERGTRLYAPHSLAPTFVPLVIREIKKKLDDNAMDIRISVTVGGIAECVEAVAFSYAPFMVSYEIDGLKIMSPSDLERWFPKLDAEDRKNQIPSKRIAKDRLIPVCAKANFERYEKMLQAGTPIPYSTYSSDTYLREIVDQKIEALKLKDKVKLVHDAQMADTLRNLVRERQGIAWVLLSTAQRALEGEELQRFDFNLGHEPNIELDIKLFRSVDSNDPTVDRIWDIADTLEKALTPRDFI
jgi:DNA-binding transcriptional LysR family regulator